MMFLLGFVIGILFTIMVVPILAKWYLTYKANKLAKEIFR
jgi:hypothetical protein